MEIKVFEKNVASSDGIHQLAGRVYVPEGGIRGIFHVVHGMIEQREISLLSRLREHTLCLQADGYFTLFTV